MRAARRFVDHLYCQNNSLRSRWRNNIPLDMVRKRQLPFMTSGKLQVLLFSKTNFERKSRCTTVPLSLFLTYISFLYFHATFQPFQVRSRPCRRAGILTDSTPHGTAHAALIIWSSGAKTDVKQKLTATQQPLAMVRPWHSSNTPRLLPVGASHLAQGHSATSEAAQ